SSSRVAVLASTWRITSPPRPPLPPSGPPSGLNFSRWIEAQPLPPLPAWTCSVARSANSATVLSPLVHRKGGPWGFRSPGPPLLRMWCPADLGLRLGAGRRLGRYDADGPTAAMGAELDGAGDQREQRIVAASAHAVARVEVRAVLPHEDLARVHCLAAVPLHAEALGLRVTAVTAG